MTTLLAQWKRTIPPEPPEQIAGYVRAHAWLAIGYFEDAMKALRSPAPVLEGMAEVMEVER